MLATLDPVYKAIQDLPEDDEFWWEIGSELILSASQYARQAVIEGALAAQSVGVIVDMDAIHEEALAVTRTWANEWWSKLEPVTRNGMRQALITWQEQGLGKRGLPDLIDAMKPFFGEARAERIAVTETTRLFAEGSKLAARQDENVGGMEWQTARDERVCEVCNSQTPGGHPKDGDIYPIDQTPDCPRHVNCRCALIPVSWRYIRQNADKWQGGPIPEEPVELML